jgi:ABC-2 type transport system ATP-binding protein
LKASKAEPVATAREVRKRYGGILALDGVSLELGAGDWVGLIGPNGAGKTTLLLAVAGLVRLDGGEIRILGARIAPHVPSVRRAAIGLVPQEIALYPALSAVENLSTFGRLSGLSRSELAERVAWALDWTGLGHRAGEPVGGFSIGMQRRLNIACGVLHRPRLILLDEPTVGVDPQARVRIREMLADLRGEGACLLQSTHQIEEVESVCDRWIVLDRGRVVGRGSRDELLGASGAAGNVRLVLDRRADPRQLGAGWRVEGCSVRTRLGDVAEELPGILARVREAGYRVRHLETESPTLEALFTRLTGSELRE